MWHNKNNNIVFTSYYLCTLSKHRNKLLSNDHNTVLNDNYIFLPSLSHNSYPLTTPFPNTPNVSNTPNSSRLLWKVTKFLDWFDFEVLQRLGLWFELTTADYTEREDQIYATLLLRLCDLVTELWFKSYKISFVQYTLTYTVIRFYIFFQF